MGHVGAVLRFDVRFSTPTLVAFVLSLNAVKRFRTRQLRFVPCFPALQYLLGCLFLAGLHFNERPCG